MTRRRTADFSLDAALRDPGFTPREGDADALIDRLDEGERGAQAEVALLRLGLAAARAAARRAEEAEPPLRARLTALVGRALAKDATEIDEALLGFVASRLSDADERTRRAAAVALGKLPTPRSEAELAQALVREPSPSVRRALLAALGKVGSSAALETMSAHEGGDAELEKIRSRARLMVHRTALRVEGSAFDASVPVAEPTPVVLTCREGLEAILIGELDPSLGPRRASGSLGSDQRLGRVECTLTGAPERLFAARTMLSFGFALPPQPLASASKEDLVEAVIASLTSEGCVRLLAHHTRGPIRYRLDWAHGGKRRAAIWAIAAKVAELRPELVNDPTDSPWEAVIHETSDAVAIDLVPRVTDPRFSYRQGDVPAASHPTLAAALVRVAGVRAEDVVWDPFVGSGTELCERALAGPYRRLIGSDRDPGALRVAEQNLAVAGAVGAELSRADANTFDPGGVTLIVTNPPMGRRVLRGVDLGVFLESFIEHAAFILSPGGRLVWLSPLPDKTLRAAEAHGLRVELRQPVDMGGFTAELQAFVR